MKRSLVFLLGLLLALTASPAHAGDGTAPAGDNVTSRIANRLGASWRSSAHSGPGTHSEDVALPKAPGRPWVRVVHIQRHAVKDFVDSLRGTTWLVRSKRGGRFVIMLPHGRFEFRAQYGRTDCRRAAKCEQVARWVTHKLGPGWRIVPPAKR